MSSKRPAAPAFATVDKDIILAVCDTFRGDGHGIYPPSVLLNARVPQDLVDTFTRTYHSDGTPKGTITTSSGPVGALTGVYSLEVYERIGGDLELSCSMFTGRGFRAQDWDRRIREHLAEQ